MFIHFDHHYFGVLVICDSDKCFLPFNEVGMYEGAFIQFDIHTLLCLIWDVSTFSSTK